MVHCRSCSHESPDDSRFCSWCAAPLEVTSAMTAVLPAPSSSRPPVGTVSRLTSTSAVDEGRFLPGTLLAGRYRVAGLLGRGGMGEVYRATDLTLGQAVALKFLPEAMARDDRALARFYNEVRIARQVTHPNVCRVYDIGEVEGLHYISMEFVDGEDLASLLRRIGRLPADKAIDTARGLCAGLAAAHEKGVLHRDLKPANVMIDGRGQVIIMDFGLAGLTEQLQADVRSGTPAYMSPEQLAGTEVTAKSDIYALGLLLYELFTGRRAFEAASLMELMQMQERASPASITTLVKDLDPTVERAILRCLQPDPRLRPNSALAVAAALPGGDPLAAALAAGETPSPELVAAAGETEGLKPVLALAWLGAALAGIVVIGVLGVRFGITERIPLDVSAEALARDARNLLRSFGYAQKPGDSAWGLGYNGEYLDYLKQHPDRASARWKDPAAGEPPVIRFWYRESPREMLAERGFNASIQFADPPLQMSGSARLYTDAEGRLERLEAVPPQVEPPPATGAAPFDWTALFRAAGLDPAHFHGTDPQWTPLANWDARSAWTGDDPRTGAPLRVEAASWRGRPVFFRVIGPWTQPERMQGGSGRSTGQLAVMAAVYTALITAVVIAWYNLRNGKGDRRGALKLSLLYSVSQFASQFLVAHHTATTLELDVFWKTLSTAAINGAALWTFYLALEPWVRRRWPQTMISWSRYTTQGIRDPLVGRETLYGVFFGCVLAGMKLLQLGLHGSGGEPVMPSLEVLLGGRAAISSGLIVITAALFDAMILFFFLFITRVVLRRQWIAAAAFVVLVAAVSSAGTAYPWTDVPVNVLFGAIYAFVLLRFGLVALIVTDGIFEIMLGAPRTLDFSSWYAGVGVLPLVLAASIAYYGFRMSLAGRRLLREDLL